MTFGHLYACDGCFVGFPAILSLFIAVVVLIGSIYMLLWSNLGARQAYLVVMVALSAWMILLSAMWLFGAPGTTPGTGPRGREPAWVPFTPTSEQAGVFHDELIKFPDGWELATKGGDGAGIYPGKIDAHGELVTIVSVIEEAEARLAAKQGTPATKPEDWSFHDSAEKPVTGDASPRALVRFFEGGNTPLIVGVRIPATAKHPQVTVFAYRDKGLVFLYALYFLAVSVLLFIVHLVLLARFERTQKERERAMAGQPALT